MSDDKGTTGTPSGQKDQNDVIEKLSADEIRQSTIVRKTPGQRRLTIGIIVVGIIVMIAVVMNVAP